MSGPLKAERQSLKSTLEAAGITAFDHLPARYTPPAAVVLPGSPYLVAGPTFGEHTVTFDVELIAARGDNSVQTDELDDLIDKTVVALLAAGWDLGDIAKPSMLQPREGEMYLAVPVTVSTPIRLS